MDNSCCSKCQCARGHRTCVCPCALSLLEACGKNRGSMCCRALCGCGYGTWMLQDDRIAFISQQTSLLASSLGPPRFYLAAVEKNREKAWDQNYATTGNGGLGWYVMWTRFRNDGNVSTYNVAGVGQFNPP